MASKKEKLINYSLKLDLEKAYNRFAIPHPRIVYFFWLALKYCIASKEFIFLCHITTDQAYPHCHNPIENPMHILRFCPLACSLWEVFGVTPTFFKPRLSICGMGAFTDLVTTKNSIHHVNLGALFPDDVLVFVDEQEQETF